LASAEETKRAFSAREALFSAERRCKYTTNDLNQNQKRERKRERQE